MTANGPLGRLSQMRDGVKIDSDKDFHLIDNADIIHAPANPGQFDRGYSGPTACGKALRACSDDITLLSHEQFEALGGDDRRCFECKTITS